MSKNVSVEILFTDESSQLSYQILGRGDCIESKNIQFHPTKRHVIEFTPSFKMIPKAKIIFNYITSDGEIISDQIDVEFGNELVNQVRVIELVR